MVNDSPKQMDAVFAALADSTRRAMVARLSRGPASIGELGAPFDISKPAVTKHVKALERAGLIERRKHGRIHRCTLNSKPMRHAGDWIDRYRKFWEASLTELARYVEKTTKEETE